MNLILKSTSTSTCTPLKLGFLFLSQFHLTTGERRVHDNRIRRRDSLLSSSSNFTSKYRHSLTLENNFGSILNQIRLVGNGDDGNDNFPSWYPLGSAGIPRQPSISVKSVQSQNSSKPFLNEETLKWRRKQVFSGNPYLFDELYGPSSLDDTMEYRRSNHPKIEDYGIGSKWWYNEEDFNFEKYQEGFDEQIEQQVDEVDVKLDTLRRQAITPVVYRFFARSQAAKAVAASITAGATGGSIPFILLVPNVDHWKVTGTELASRGYNVIAVGPQLPDDDDIDEEEDEDDLPIHDIRKRYLQGPALVLQLMDALRWTKVVIVGCDSESLMAIQAAATLSSSPMAVSSHTNDRQILGLILCGNLKETENIMREADSNPSPDFEGPTSYYYNRRLPSSSSAKARPDFVVDRFLEGRLRCPFTVIWDGDGWNHAIPAATVINARKIMIEDVDDQDYWYHHLRHRSLLIGGGSAPHRRRPEYFAWVLSRFVEEQIAPAVEIQLKHQKAVRGSGNRYNRFGNNHSPFFASHRLPEIIAHEESFVVFGRVAATALFYGMAVKVLLYQYDSLRMGIDTIAIFRQTTIGTIRRISLQILSALLFRPSLVSSLDHTNNATVQESEIAIGKDGGQKPAYNATETETSAIDKKSGLSKFRSTTGGLLNFMLRWRRALPFQRKNGSSKDDETHGQIDSRRTENEYLYNTTTPNEVEGEEQLDLENLENQDDSDDDEEQTRIRPMYWLDHVIT